MTRRPPLLPAPTGVARPGDARVYGAPVIAPTATVAAIGEAAARAVLGRPGLPWILALGAALALVGACAALRLGAGPTAAPPLAAAGFGWWSGLASGCLTISGLLLLARVEWRCGIGRIVQTAALLSAGVAALTPGPGGGLALGALAASAFGLWAVALVPDLAGLHERPEMRRIRWRAGLARLAAAGWRGAARQWLVWERACRALALAGILAAVALQADYALALAARAGRPDTLLPVALIVGAALSGAGLTTVLAVALRRIRGFDGLVTGRHLDILGRLVLALGLAGLYCHVTEMTVTLLYGSAAERAALPRRLAGEAAPAFWTLMLAGLLPSQLLWINAARRSPAMLALIGALAALGACAGHVLIVQAGLPAGVSAAALPAALADLAGGLGLFGLGLLLAFRLVPAVSVAETRGLALAHNRRAAAPAPEAMEAPSASRPGLAAAFASEAGLVEALRALHPSEAALRVDAFGPVPMPEAAAALRRDERAIRDGALTGGGLAVAAFLAGQAAAMADRMPGGLAGGAGLDGARLAVPALSAAAAGASLGIVAALVWHASRARPALAAPPDWRETFVLALAPGAAPLDADALARRLSALPEGGGRPVALRRTGP